MVLPAPRQGQSNISGFAKFLELVAHEPGHGVLKWTANLEYRNQSGTLTEHLADVLGAVITQHIENSTADNADWLIADKKE